MPLAETVNVAALLVMVVAIPLPLQYGPVQPLPPYWTDAVIMVVPAATAVAVPELLTVATLGFEDVHVNCTPLLTVPPPLSVPTAM
ncbi:MAG: hypothetical protein ACRER7_01530 [Gammaproteobacteria bacterium]